MIFLVLKCFWVGFVPTNELCIVGELVGPGCMAVAVGVCDR